MAAVGNEVTAVWLNGLAEDFRKYSDVRANNGAFRDSGTMGLMKHLATEVVEATEAYAEYRFVKDTNTRGSTDGFGAELADVIACALIAAAREKIDIDKALAVCLEKNRLRAEGKGGKK